MTRTFRKRQIRKCRTTKRRIGGGAETEFAVLSYVENIAVQILHNIEEPLQHHYKNTKFYKMDDDKYELFRYFCADMKINFGKFKIEGGDLINKRNETLHPKNLVDAAKKCLVLCQIHNFKVTHFFVYSIINSFVNATTITRAKTRILEDGYELVMKKGVAATTDTQPVKPIPKK
jgi:hypothetical protein